MTNTTTRPQAAQGDATPCVGPFFLLTQEVTMLRARSLERMETARQRGDSDAAIRHASTHQACLMALDRLPRMEDRLLPQIDALCHAAALARSSSLAVLAEEMRRQHAGADEAAQLLDAHTEAPLTPWQ